MEKFFDRAFFDKLIIGNLEREIYGNPLQTWIIALGTAILLYFLFRIIRRVILSRLKKYDLTGPKGWVHLTIELLERVYLTVLVIMAIYLGALYLKLPEKVEQAVSSITVIVLLIQVGILASHALTFWFSEYKKQKIETSASTVTTLGSVSFVLRIVLWVLIALAALDNLGVDITTLVAGLGISGIAVALAVQNILGDLFASFSIVLDKPFVIGDFIIIGDYLGTVEHIGLKTTRIRSLSGEQIIFSNTDLLSSRIRNYKRMFERRVVFSIGVVYQTSHEKLIRIPEIIKEIVEEQKKVWFDRAHFKEYGTYALNFEVVYWIRDPDYNIYMDTQQAINLAIFRQFREAGIEFAYPTQTLYLRGDGDGLPGEKQAGQIKNIFADTPEHQMMVSPQNKQ